MTEDDRGVLRRWAQLREKQEDLDTIGWFFGIVTLVGLAGALAYGACFTDCWLGGVGLWAFALLACGAGVGFLFGIPKVLQGAPAAAPAAPVQSAAGDVSPMPISPGLVLTYQQRVNTNLEEISDWLTKIIVGLGLIQLKTAPDHLWRFANVITGSLGKDVPPGFGVGMILFFTILGFLFGYLVTRLFLQGALARAERLVELEGKAGVLELEKQSAQATKDIARALDVAKKAPTTATSAPAGPPPEQQLRALADAYMNVSIKDWKARVSAKNDLAAQMAAFVLRGEVSRDSLVESSHQGCLIALAAAVQYAPEAADTDRLLAAATRVDRLHVRYRFVLAFARLLERDFVNDEQRRAIGRTLTVFEGGADESLRLAISGLRKQLDRLP